MSSSAFTPTTTTVTNEVPVNVPVVTAWEAYTPTFEGFGTPTAVSALWRRVGDNIQVSGNFTSGTPTATLATISLPSGLNLDSTKINGPGQTKILGLIIRSNSSATTFPINTRGPFVITESKALSTSKVYLSFTANTGSGGVFEVANGTNIVSAGEQLTFEFNAPISQWSGSGTTTLATRAVEEYLSTTSFSSLNVNRGPNGATLPTTTPAGTFESISFGPNPWQTTWLPTDIVSIEVDPFGTGKWTSISGSIEAVSLTVLEGSLTYAGLGFYFDGTNWILLRGKYRNPNTSNGLWSSISSGLRYRIKKVSSGAQVGYPVSTRNIIGDTSGSVSPVGMLGEIIGSTLRSGTGGLTYSTALSGSGSWGNGTATSMGTQTLSKGTYLACINSSVGLAAGASRSFDLQLFIGGTNITPNFYYSTPGFNNGTADLQMVIPILITGDSVVVDVRGRVTGGADTVTVYGQMTFVRIA